MGDLTALVLYGLIVVCSITWGALVTYLAMSALANRKGRKFP